MPIRYPVSLYDSNGIVVCHQKSLNGELCSLAESTIETILKAKVLYAPDPSTAAGAQAVNRSAISALTFLLYDIILTTDDEVKLMWP
jgi:hypothetical protein